MAPAARIGRPGEWRQHLRHNWNQGDVIAKGPDQILLDIVQVAAHQGHIRRFNRPITTV